MKVRFDNREKRESTLFNMLCAAAVAFKKQGGDFRDEFAPKPGEPWDVTVTVNGHEIDPFLFFDRLWKWRQADVDMAAADKLEEALSGPVNDHLRQMEYLMKDLRRKIRKAHDLGDEEDD